MAMGDSNTNYIHPLMGVGVGQAQQPQMGAQTAFGVQPNANQNNLAGLPYFQDNSQISQMPVAPTPLMGAAPVNSMQQQLTPNNAQQPPLGSYLSIMSGNTDNFQQGQSLDPTTGQVSYPGQSPQQQMGSGVQPSQTPNSGGVVGDFGSGGNIAPPPRKQGMFGVNPSMLDIMSGNTNNWQQGQWKPRQQNNNWSGGWGNWGNGSKGWMNG